VWKTKERVNANALEPARVTVDRRKAGGLFQNSAPVYYRDMSFAIYLPPCAVSCTNHGGDSSFLFGMSVSSTVTGDKLKPYA
jgi:hypothetical protein